MYEFLVRPILFALSQNDAEKAHVLTVRMIKTIQATPLLLRMIEEIYAVQEIEDPVTVAGIKFPHRIGLAAGLDKQGELLPYMQAIGFGFVEVGSVLPRPQVGNARPRLFRLPEYAGLNNRMGFNSKGAEAVAHRLRAVTSKIRIPIGISLGKQKETENKDAAEDYVTVLHRLAPYADYYAVNVSSPNTPGLRELQGRDYLENLIRDIDIAEGRRARHLRQPRKPIFVKLAPDLSKEEIEISVAAIVDGGGSGIIFGNTTLKPPPHFDFSEHPGVRPGEGGYSGPELLYRMIEGVKFIRTLTPRFPIIACGGISTPYDASLALDSGADLVQILTALIYQGPGLVQKIRSGI